MKVLLTGAGGFIGSAIARRLRDAGVQVVAVDAFIPQAHHPEAAEADGVADVHRVDIRDAAALTPLLRGVDVVCHQAAMVGAGLSAADLPHYAAHNDLGTATLLAAMHAAGTGRLVLASSMVVYGEGRYTCPDHGDVVPEPRSPADLGNGVFDSRCPRCARPLRWAPVAETARLDPRSSYAASKVAQEHYTSSWVRHVEGRAVVLRYHNVYGPGMPRDTPYSGVAAIFRSALERGDPPQVYEDGAQMRDFVHVDDVVRANLMSLRRVVEGGGAAYEAFNVCSGHPVAIADVARLVAGSPLAGRRGIDPVVTGRYRLGDVRHIVASPSRASTELGFTAEVSPEQGLAMFASAPLR